MLLSRFWKAMRPNDRIFGANIASVLDLVRRRSWNLKVVPSAEIHLRQVYVHELLDTQKMWHRDGIFRREDMRRRVPGQTLRPRSGAQDDGAAMHRELSLRSSLRLRGR